MDNAKTDFYGKFEYNGKMYPFYYEEPLVKVIQSPCEYNEDFEDATNVEVISGITNSGKTIVFIKCEFIGNKFIGYFSNILFSTKGFVLFNDKEVDFNSIQFESEALGIFYPSLLSVNRERLFDEFTYKIEEKKDSFNVEINNEIITVEFKNVYLFSLQSENKYIGEKSSVCVMKFKQNKSVKDIVKYYLYLSDFLSFVNFRRCIVIDQFVLLQSENEVHKRIAEGRFFSEEAEYDCKVESSIIYSDINKEISNLFSYVAVQREKYNNINGYMPLTSKEFKEFDWEYWLKTAISFEGEYEKKYKDRKYEEDQNFAHVKDYLLKQIEKGIQESGCSLRNKKNKPFAKFKNLIEKEDTRLEGKFKFALEHFSYEISAIRENNIKRLHISDQTDLPQKYAECRNNLAHGNIIEMTDEDVINFVLMRAFIYCFILERANISKETRKKVIEKLFLQ